MPGEIAGRATSLLALTGAPIDRVELLQKPARQASDAGGGRRLSVVTRRWCAGTAFWLDGRRVEVDTSTGTIWGWACSGDRSTGARCCSTPTLAAVALGVGEVVRVHGRPG